MRRGGNEHVSSRFAFTPHFPDAAPFHPLAPSMKSARTSTSPAANAERNERRRIAVVATVPYTVNMFLAPHLAALARRHDVTILANGRVDEIAPVLRERCDFIQIGIAREIAPLTDLRTLAELRQHFQTGSFDLVLSMTPKAGLLAMVTARIVGVPTRVHWFTGQVWATRRGLARRALKLLDGVTANCATHLLSDSPSQRIFLDEEGVIPAARVEVPRAAWMRDASSPTARRATRFVDSCAFLMMHLWRSSLDDSIATRAFLNLLRRLRRSRPHIRRCISYSLAPTKAR
jgi:hypothetical protein